MQKKFLLGVTCWQHLLWLLQLHTRLLLRQWGGIMLLLLLLLLHGSACPGHHSCINACGKIHIGKQKLGNVSNDILCLPLPALCLLKFTCTAVLLYCLQRPSRLEASAATQQGGSFNASSAAAAAAAARSDGRGSSSTLGALSTPACGRKGSDIGLNPSVLCPVYCSAMPWVDCTMLRYHCTRYPDINLCPTAFAEGRFPAGCSSRDFVRVDGCDRQASSDGWRPEETML
jgi:hypothetical protein